MRARSTLLKAGCCLVQSHGCKLSLSCSFAWEYAKAEFDSQVFKSLFFLRVNLACIFHNPKFSPCENKAYGIVFSMSYCTYPVVASSRGNIRK